MTTIGFQDLFRVSLLWSTAGDTEGDLEACFPGSFLDAFAFDEEHLPHMGEIQVLVECAVTPNAARFDAPMFTAVVWMKCALPRSRKSSSISACSVGWLPLTLKW